MAIQANNDNLLREAIVMTFGDEALMHAHLRTTIMANDEIFYLQKDSLFAVPIVHYNMEMAAQVKQAIDFINPDCIAVELPETMQKQMLHAATRLPDISIVLTYDQQHDPLYFMCEPCDPSFEALRSASEKHIDAFCVDLDVDHYPDIHENIPDPYAIHRLGLKKYFEIYETIRLENLSIQNPLDAARETHMARRLKELCLRYDRVLFIGGMSHTTTILNLIDASTFPEYTHRSGILSSSAL